MRISALRIRLATLTFALLLLPALAAAQEPSEVEGKAPWQWNREERVNARFHPVQVRERLRAYGLKHGRPDSVERELASGEEVPVVIDGARNPELFLPWELFDNLMSLAFDEVPEIRGRWRESFEQRAAERGVPVGGGFWTELEAVSESYVMALRRSQELGRQAQRATEEGLERIAVQQDGLSPQLCRGRVEALDAARERFGAAWFDRFLYETVASRLVSSGTRTVADLHDAAGGCQLPRAVPG